VIATGSKPRPLPIPGAEKLMITSDEMLERTRAPRFGDFRRWRRHIAGIRPRLCARSARDVTILEALPQLLPAMDADAVARIQTTRANASEFGVKTAVSVKRIEPANNRLRVVFTHHGTEHAGRGRSRRQRLPGRMANFDTPLSGRLGNVEHSNGRVAVDCHLRSTSNSHSMFCGDAVPISPQLSPIATYEGDSSAATSWRGRNTARTTKVLRHRSTPCRRWPLSA